MTEEIRIVFISVPREEASRFARDIITERLVAEHQASPVDYFHHRIPPAFDDGCHGRQTIGQSGFVDDIDHLGYIS